MVAGLAGGGGGIGGGGSSGGGGIFGEHMSVFLLLLSVLKEKVDQAALARPHPDLAIRPRNVRVTRGKALIERRKQRAVNRRELFSQHFACAFVVVSYFH